MPDEQVPVYRPGLCLFLRHLHKLLDNTTRPELLRVESFRESTGAFPSGKRFSTISGNWGENVREYSGGRMRLVRTQNRRVSFRVYFTLALGFLGLFFVGTAWAGVTGSISGVIRDSSGAVVPGVQVTAHNTGTGLQWTTSTDDKGFYSFQALPVGAYDIEAAKAGFKGYKQSGIVLDVNASIPVDVTLQAGAVAENITVTSNAVHVEETST